MKPKSQLVEKERNIILAPTKKSPPAGIFKRNSSYLLELTSH
jgi:hypothetical protein